MPGTFIFKPIEANLTHNTDLIGKMNPYCVFKVGDEEIKSEVCKKGGKHPHWNDTIIIPLENQSVLAVELMDKDKFTSDDNIGNFLIDLKEVQSQGRVSKWYPLTYKNKPAGEIFMEAGYQPEITGIPQNVVVEEKVTITEPSTAVQKEVVREHLAGAQGEKIFVEQKQVVEPHVFTKAVDVVETRPVIKEIEVTEPVKVMKDVQYTEVVPVVKEVEVVEPQVVKKAVEVIEPRLVTKTIQVVENVPVMKEVDVIEPKTIVKEVETFEPRTFTKQVEVTEQVPVRKQVETTEPVVVTKAVDFVEPVITTKTVTKELVEPVVIDEKVTTTVGPASVIGVEANIQEKVLVSEPMAATATAIGTMNLTEPVNATQTMTKAMTVEAQEPFILDEKITTTTATTIIDEEVTGKEAVVDVEKEVKVVSSKKRKDMQGGIQKGNLKQVKLNNIEEQIEEETKVTYTKEVVKSAPKNVKKKKTS